MTSRPSPLWPMLPTRQSAYLVLMVRRGHPVSLRVYSELTPTVMHGERTFLVAKSAANSYARAKRRIDTWWHGRRPHQKRALLNNALIPTWAPPEV